ncbi:rust resistance kinase Lr10-like [Rosa rugosa]|uniref:rust resistance kinase Lr10-like n=1 Tax=Rosa rugosa TaxID=74645 RepID=UPI002B412F96|nr:rust resistance kinase Lr10-like [Rosa rugosa]
MQKMLLNLLCSWVLLVTVLDVDIVVHGGSVGPENCTEARCKDHGPAIRFPFRLKGMQPLHCGYPGFDLSCNKDKETVLQITPSSADNFFVKRIDYAAQEIEIYLYNQYDDIKYFDDICIPMQIFELGSSPFKYSDAQHKTNYTIFSCPPSDERERYPSFCTLTKLSPCLGNHSSKMYALQDGCAELKYMPNLVSCTKVEDYMSVPSVWMQPVKLKWSRPSCQRCEETGKTCGLLNQVADDQTTEETQCLDVPKGPNRGRQILEILGICALVTVLIGAATLMYYVYSSKKIEEENQLRIEKFLDDYRALKPSRYAYDDIRRITNQFADKLGQGAYGTVYKGKLSSELLVAVKILDNSNEKGEDFINEVGTMGLIHHVNVVRLVGFCADGFVRALIYEYLPNGSLQNFLSSADDKNSFLGWEKLQNIALGIAKGIEYLHQGCDQRILHFDIKPNNILLDQDFTPKVSDFGLAKLCSKDQSAISMTTARGTMGYIAPEVFSRNFGNVSYKSDVYSFGVLLLEMVGGKKNFKVMEDSTSHIYFPEWIYNLLEHGSDLRIHIEDDGDVKVARKLAIVGLWCIQWHPVDRPSMNIVVQMLEREGDNLTMPPYPFASTSN